MGDPMISAHEGCGDTVDRARSKEAMRRRIEEVRRRFEEVRRMLEEEEEMRRRFEEAVRRMVEEEQRPWLRMLEEDEEEQRLRMLEASQKMYEALQQQKLLGKTLRDNMHNPLVRMMLFGVIKLPYNDGSSICPKYVIPNIIDYMTRKSHSSAPHNGYQAGTTDAKGNHATKNILMIRSSSEGTEDSNGRYMAHQQCKRAHQRCKRAVSLQAMERTWQCYSNKPIKSFLDAIPCDVKISVTTSPKGGIDIKIGSHTKHVPKYLSVHHLLVQMVLFAHKSSDGISSYIKSIMPKSIFDMAKRLCSFALPNVSQHHSDPVSCKDERGIAKAVGAKTSEPWIVATGSPHHATGNRALLSGSITEHDGLFFHAVNRAPMQVRGCGALVTAAVVLPDVWVVPGLRANLVSVRQLNELGYIVGFGGGACYISSAADGTIIGKATLGEGGLYVLDFLKVPLGM